MRRPETHPSVICIVFGYFFLVEPAAVSVMQGLRKVPVVKSLQSTVYI